MTAVAVTVAACLLSAACGGTTEEPRPPREDLLLGEFLDASPETCGLRERPPSLAALERARTVERQVAEVISVVEQIRGLKATKPLTPTFVTQGELRARLEKLVREELADRDVDAAERALYLLGAAPVDFDLRAAIAAIGEATAGLYDPDRKQILVVDAGGRELVATQSEVLAHELEHALADQTLTLPEGATSDRWGDTHLAAAALVEGDAMVVAQFRFVAALTSRSFLDALLRAPADDLFAVPGLPYVIEQSISFPYLEGIGFVCALYARGGWKLVDAAYRRPPRSTAEILFPARYLRGETPKRPQASGPLPAPWKRDRFGGVFGAADLLWLFRAPGDDERGALDRALARAGAWAGGRIDIWSRGAQSAAAIALVQRPDAPSLCRSLVAWYDRAFPKADRDGAPPRTIFRDRRQNAVVQCRGDQVRLGIAPSVRLARMLVG